MEVSAVVSGQTFGMPSRIACGLPIRSINIFDVLGNFGATKIKAAKNLLLFLSGAFLNKCIRRTALARRTLSPMQPCDYPERIL
jgi:hypothetical protein